ncbi:MAG: DUF1361 domain-containing protein [Actinobacteria bacterium]|nr:DUF1361 domain-containing protein [Actinomycetota bacterium]
MNASSLAGRASARRLAVVVVLLAASFLLAVAVMVRIVRTGSFDTWNLVWNLFLAWIPFVLALLVYDGARRSASRPLLVVGGLLWLLFLPNAPYIVTDAIWLDDWRLTGAPFWYDLALYVVAAGTGGILGFVSIYLVQRACAARRGEVAGWLLAVTALGLSGAGVYLGRVLRWNSWDLLTRPEALLRDVASGLVDPFAYPRALVLTIACAAALLAGYAFFYGTLRTQLAKLEDR